MGKTKTLILSAGERASLEKGYRYGSCHRFRMRCKGVLMKADNVPVKEISSFVGYGPLAVYHWIERFREQGVEGLREKGGRGPAPLMGSSDTEAVRAAVKEHRLSIKAAKAEWERSSGRQVSDSSFRRFLGLLAQDIGV